MAVVLGINAVFHDPSAALLVDGVTVAAAEEERFSRRKHGKEAVAFSTWELPERAGRWCLQEAGLTPADVDAIAYSYDPDLAPRPQWDGDLTADGWEELRTLYVRRAPRFLATAFPGLDPDRVRFVAHHVAHAASAHLAAGWDRTAVIVLDGRGERSSGLLGHAVGPDLEVLRTFDLPHSLGLWYEGLTDHLGFRRASDEYKVMALASYGTPRFLPRLRELVHAEDGRLRVDAVPWAEFCPRRPSGEAWEEVHADLAASVQAGLQETVLTLATWLHRRTGERRAVLAGGVALNCVNNTWLLEHGPFEDLWVQPAAGDAGTALGAAMRVAADLGDAVAPMPTAALGPAWDDDELEAALAAARVPVERPGDLALAVGDVIAADGVVAWFQGRSEFGPRALGHRSLLANATKPGNVERLNDVKGREQFRPVAPMVTLERAAEIFEGGPIPSPYMLFTHRVADAWRARIPAVVHVDGTARPQTVDRREEPLVARLLDAVDARSGVPVVVNTSLNTADRPIVNDPRDALECFGSAPVDVLAIGPFLVRRPT